MESTGAVIVPDLLNAVPREPSNLQALREQLQFAFASGESAGALRRALAGCDASPSDWQATGFARELFVDELIAGGLRIPATRFGKGFRPPQDLAFLRKVLLQPPRDLAAVGFRQQTLAELQASDALRQRFEAVYRRLTELREDLDSPSVMGWEYSTRRRIDLLLHIRETVDAVAGEFADARAGLGRIRAWAQAFRDSPGYATLRDFVDYEGRLASVQLRFQVGVDGSLRQLRVEALEENRANPHFQSPVTRLRGWLRLWWRGARLGRDELVARVVEAVFDAIEPHLVHVLVLIGHMEFYLAALAFAERCADAGLATCLPDFVDEGSPRTLRGLFNPLLLGQARAPVPCDLEMPRADLATLVTGPNSGGKTRLLQALGLAQLLGQGGLPVPACEAQLWFRSGLFASLHPEQAADQAEGRLGSELLRIRQLFEQTPRGALILLDELCAGTNPSEGEEILVLVLGLLDELAPETYLTTHFLRLAEQLARDPAWSQLRFWQVALDVDQEPTYRFVPGVAPSSLAGQTARRLGVTREQLRDLIARRAQPDRDGAGATGVAGTSADQRASDDEADAVPRVATRGLRRHLRAISPRVLAQRSRGSW